MTSLSPHDPLPSISVDVALVIDVLRATTVMTTAIASGAAEITTVAKIEEALAIAAEASSPSSSALSSSSLSSSSPSSSSLSSGSPSSGSQPTPELTSRPLLCGERHCQPIDGFDFGNSPADYVRSAVADRRLVLTTTNGTRAIERNESARQMLAVSFLNLSATAMAVAHANTVHLVCAGTNGSVSGEDVLLAGAIVDKLASGIGRVELCDSSRLARSFWHENADCLSLEDRLKQSLGARNLIQLGLGADIGLCAAIDQANVLVHRVRRAPATFVGEVSS